MKKENKKQKIYLLFFSDGFTTKIEKASFDRIKIEELVIEYNGGEANFGPYECIGVEID